MKEHTAHLEKQVQYLKEQMRLSHQLHADETTLQGGQTHYVLKRHGWRKDLPRSKHPKKSSEEAINASL